MWIFNERLPGYFSVSDIVPIEFSEPGVVFDVFSVIACSQALRGVGVQQVQDDVSRPQGEEIRKFYDAFQYFFVDVARFVVVVEGRVTCEEFVDEDTDAPVIHCFSVSCFIGFL